MSIVSYVLIYFLLPDFYQRYEIRQYEDMVDGVIKEIHDTNDLNRETRILTEFSNQQSIDAFLYDSINNIVFDYYHTRYIISDVNNNSDSQSIELTGEKAEFADDSISLSVSYGLLGEGSLLCTDCRTHFFKSVCQTDKETKCIRQKNVRNGAKCTY